MANITRNRYELIVETIFKSHYAKGIKSFDFSREEFVTVADNLAKGRYN